MIKNLIKDDIMNMLSRITNTLQDSDETADDNMVTNITAELDNLELIDLFVTREYLKDQLDECEAEDEIEIEDTENEEDMNKDFLDEDESLMSAEQEGKTYTDSDGNEVLVVTDADGKMSILNPVTGNTVIAAEEEEEDENTEDAESEETEDTKEAEDAEDVETGLADNVNTAIEDALVKKNDLNENYEKLLNNFSDVTGDNFLSISDIVNKKIEAIKTIDDLIDEIKELKINDPEIEDTIKAKLSELDNVLNSQGTVLENLVNEAAEVINDDAENKSLESNEIISDDEEENNEAETIQSSTIVSDEEDNTDDFNSDIENISEEENELEESEEEIESEDENEDEDVIEEAKTDVNELIESIMSISVEDEGELKDKVDDLKTNYINKLENILKDNDSDDLEDIEENASEEENTESTDDEFNKPDTITEDVVETDEDKSVTSSVVFDTKSENPETVIDNKKSDAIGLKTTTNISKKSFEDDLEIVINNKDKKEVQKEFKGVTANSKTDKVNKKD